MEQQAIARIGTHSLYAGTPLRPSLCRPQHHAPQVAPRRESDSDIECLGSDEGGRPAALRRHAPACPAPAALRHAALPATAAPGGFRPALPLPAPERVGAQAKALGQDGCRVSFVDPRSGRMLSGSRAPRLQARALGTCS